MIYPDRIVEATVDGVVVTTETEPSYLGSLINDYELVLEGAKAEKSTGFFMLEIQGDVAAYCLLRDGEVIKEMGAMKEIGAGEPPPETDEEAVEYLPNPNQQTNRTCRVVYKARRLKGDSVVEALTFVLESFLGMRKES